MKSKPKDLWRYVKSRLKSTSTIPSLTKSDGCKASTSKEKAQVLNDYFTSVFTRENLEYIPEISTYGVNDELSYLEITPERSVDDTVNNNDTVDIPACSDEANTVIDGTDNSDDNQHMSISDQGASKCSVSGTNEVEAECSVSGTNEVEAEAESSSLEEEKFANEKNNSKDC